MKKKRTKTASKKAATLTTTGAIKDGQARKVYRLKKGIPEGLRGPAALAVLGAVKKHGHTKAGGASADVIRRAMKRGFPDSTLRFYLGKFQREGVLVTRAISA